MAAGDRPTGKSLPRACAPFGYMGHLQIRDSGSRGDGIMLVSSHDLFQRGDGFGAWCPLSRRDVVLRCSARALERKVLRCERAQKNKIHWQRLHLGGLNERWMPFP